MTWTIFTQHWDRKFHCKQVAEVTKVQTQMSSDHSQCKLCLNGLWLVVAATKMSRVVSGNNMYMSAYTFAVSAPSVR